MLRKQRSLRSKANKESVVFYRICWSLFSFIEKLYWFFKRKVQMQQFIACGKDVFISRGCYFSNNTITLGCDVYIGQNCRFQSTNSKIFIGNHVMFGPNVSIHGGNHRTDLVGRYMKSVRLDEKTPADDVDVVIGNDVWVGANAIILKGVNIGEGSVVGAGSVINQDIPPYNIVVGSKSQKVFERWGNREIKEHLKIINGDEQIG